MILSGEVSGKMNRVCCGAVKNEHDHILWMVLDQSTKAVGFVTENIMVHGVRQEGFANFIAVKRRVGLIEDRLNCFFIYSYNDSHWGIVIGQG